MSSSRWPAALIAIAIGCDAPGERAGSQSGEGDADTHTDLAGDDGAAPDGGGDTVPDTSADGALDATPETSQPSAVCARWNADRAARAEGAWDGSIAECTAGTYAEPGPSNTLRQVNLYRWLAGLPPVELSADKSADAQACALMMHANDALDHSPPGDWSCWSSAGADAAGLANLATTPSVLGVDLYMADEGVPELGHRRWILSNSLGPIGVGSTSRYSCMHVILGDGRAGARWVAWPPPGEVPLQALHLSQWLDVDRGGWSIQSDFIDLGRGEVTVTRAGESLPVDVWILAQGYGSTFGLGIRPRGWRSAAGETYTVTVDGVSEPISWSFTVVDCR